MSNLVKLTSDFCRDRRKSDPEDTLAKTGEGLIQSYLQTKSEVALANLQTFHDEHVVKPALLPHHQKLLTASAISEETAQSRGYQSITTKSELKRFGFGSNQLAVPTLLLPIWNARGELVSYQSRPDSPRCDRQGKIVKYESPAGAKSHLDCNPRIPRESLQSADVPLFITEGIRKGDAAVSAGICCLALLGVWNFRGKNDQGGNTALIDWEWIALKNRQVYIVFDSDVMTKRTVHEALTRLSALLSQMGATIAYCYLPPKPDGSKVGLDDYLADGHTIKDLLHLSTSELAKPPAKPDSDTDEHSTWPYKISNGRLVYCARRLTPYGDEMLTEQPIAEFTAAITEDVTTESGARLFKIAGHGVRGHAFTTEISASAFSDERQLKAVLEAAAGAKDPVAAGMHKHLGPAIKLLTNGDLKHTQRFDRTGWHSTTFLLPGREPEGVELTLPRQLPFKITKEAKLDKGMEALDALFQANEPGLMAVVLTALFQGPLGRLANWSGERYALFVKGPTGSFKTSTLQAAMCLYGPEFLRDETLIRWGQGATMNALMRLATSAHDLPFLIDNYKPVTGGGAREMIALIHTIVEGNEKARANRNAELRETRPVHAWPVITGEDIPDSDPATIARCLVIPFARRQGESNPSLKKAQDLSPHLCAVGESWIRWLESEEGKAAVTEAGKEFPELRQKWTAYVQGLRTDTVNPNRLASNLASNQLTFQLLCQHPLIWGTACRYRDEYLASLAAITDQLTSATAESLEANRFLDCLSQLIQSERVQLLPVGERQNSLTHPDRFIGWRDIDDSLFLIPDLTIAKILEIIGKDGLGQISRKALYTQLDSLGAIQSKSHEGHLRLKRTSPDVVGRFLHLAPFTDNSQETPAVD